MQQIRVTKNVIIEPHKTNNSIDRQNDLTLQLKNVENLTQCKPIETKNILAKKIPKEYHPGSQMPATNIEAKLK